VDRFRALPRVELLGLEACVAATPLARLLGLALLDRDRVPEALLIPRCRAVHTFGMRFALDVVFVDRGGRIVEIRRRVPPRRLAHCPTADAVLEIPAAR
jgi:uncharacterized membrane protein (UPF0127 family)